MENLCQIGHAVEAALATDPDGRTLRIRSAYRDLSCKGSGPECFRRVRYPGASSDEWPDAARLPAPGFRAADRRCSESCDVPIGTLVIEFSRDVYHGKRGRCSVGFFVVADRGDGKPILCEVPHRTLRSRPVYEVTIPGRGVAEIPRREHA